MSKSIGAVLETSTNTAIILNVPVEKIGLTSD
jgi:hypothetical protein